MLTYLFVAWAKRDGTGRVFGSSAGYRLPNKAVRSPDISWITKDRLRLLEEGEWEKFPLISPDFVLELRSKTDSMRLLKAKMEEYIANGSRLGWLIDPFRRDVFVYQAGGPMETLHDPKELWGDSVLPGFTLTLADLWEATEEQK